MSYRTFLALVVIGALVSGCSSMKSVEAADGTQVKYQVISSGDTEDRLQVLNVVAGKAGDLAKAGVELKNASNFTYTFEYRFKWYDAAGRASLAATSSMIRAGAA